MNVVNTLFPAYLNTLVSASTKARTLGKRGGEKAKSIEMPTAIAKALFEHEFISSKCDLLRAVRAVAFIINDKRQKRVRW